MSTDDTITYISEKLNLKAVQVDSLKKLPEVYWKKCAQAVKIAQYKGYPLDIVMVGLIKNKPDPKVEFIHTYDFQRKSNKYLHSINIKISI